MNKLFLVDNRGEKYIVKNPKRFYEHLVQYHSNNKIADQSIHEENGFYFTVTKDLFKKVENFVINSKP